MRYPFLFLLFLLLVQVSSAWPWWSLTKPSNSSMGCERGPLTPITLVGNLCCPRLWIPDREGTQGVSVHACGACPRAPQRFWLPEVECVQPWGAHGAPLTPSLPQGMKQSYDEYADSDEDQHDAYLERMKEEGKIREENANDSSDGSGEETGEC